MWLFSPIDYLKVKKNVKKNPKKKNKCFSSCVVGGSIAVMMAIVYVMWNKPNEQSFPALSAGKAEDTMPAP